MDKITNKVLLFRNTEDGATAVEYALMAFAITAVIAVVVFALGGNVNQLFDNYNTSYEKASK